MSRPLVRSATQKRPSVAALRPSRWYKRGGPFWSDTGRTTRQATQGGSVMVWDDSSGNNDHLKAPASLNRCLLDAGLAFPGHPSLRFDGCNSFLQTPGLVNSDIQNRTICMRILPGRSYYSAILWRTVENVYIDSATVGITGQANATIPPLSNLAKDNGFTVSVVSQSGQITARCNGVANTTGGRGASLKSSVGIVGDTAASSGTPFNGFLAELLMFDRPLSAWELTIVENHLNRLGAKAGSPFPDDLPLICSHGNSITAGAATPPNIYPSSSAAARPVMPYWMASGWPGQNTPFLTANYPTVIAPLYSATRALNILLIWELTNDIENSLTAAQCIANYATYCTQARATGWQKIIVLNCLDRQQTGNTVSPSSFLTVRNAVNATLAGQFNVATGDAYVFGNGGGSIDADYMVDVSSIPVLTDSSNITYYDALMVHPNNAGHLAIAPHLSFCLGLCGA